LQERTNRKQHLPATFFFDKMASRENDFATEAMFVSGKVVSGKLLSRLSCVYLLLEKLVNEKLFSVNEKHFPVNENTFRSTKNTFQSKKNLVWFPGKCFSF
jgi:hypothetical protein